MLIGIDIRPLMHPVRTGVGEYIYELLDALFKIDKQNQYFLFYNSSGDVLKNLPKWEQENVHYAGFKYPNKLFNLALLIFKQPKLDRLILKKIKQYNNVTIKQSDNLDYWFSPNINFTAISKKCRQILTIHDLSFEYFPDCFSLKRRLWHKILNPKKACQRADMILTPSENTKRDVIGEYKISEDKIKVIYPGLSEKFRANSSEPIENLKKKYNLPDKFILFLGTLEPRKNIIGLIEAFNASELRTIGYELVIAGAKGWKFKPIMDLIAKSDKVRYIGYVDMADKQGLYVLAGIFAYPSLYEGFGFPVLEAMFAGAPVITSNRSSLPEVVRDCAYLVNPNNVDDIAQGLLKLSGNKELSDYFIQNGKRRAEQFKWEKTAEEFLQLLKINKSSVIKILDSVNS